MPVWIQTRVRCDGYDGFTCNTWGNVKASLSMTGARLVSESAWLHFAAEQPGQPDRALCPACAKKWRKDNEGTAPAPAAGT